MSKRKVAILGASGVGKHHAKWFHLAGCEVVALAGTSEETCAAAADGLREIFPFDGKAYIGISEMLQQETPDMVSICTPPHLHADHIILCLEAGCQVLCEKPLHWLPGKSLKEHEADLQRIAEAQSRTRPFACNLQFATCGDAYRDIFKEVTGVELGAPEKFLMQWTPRPGRDHPKEWFWNDLGPHALSVVMKLVTNPTLVKESIDCRVGEGGTYATFTVNSENGSPCEVNFQLTPPPGGEVIRRLGANDFVVDYAARADDEGMFHTYFKHGEQEWQFEDFMKASIEGFIDWANGEADRPYVTGDEAAANLQMQLEIFERAS